MHHAHRSLTDCNSLNPAGRNAGGAGDRLPSQVPGADNFQTNLHEDASA